MPPTGPLAVAADAPHDRGVAVFEVDARLRLLEREEILEALDCALADAASGRVGMVLVAGEAGVGKTAAVRTFCARQAAAHALGRLRRPVHAAAAGTVPGRRRATPAAPSRRPWPRAPGPTRWPPRCSARRAPSIVVLEDLHWADEATLDVLRSWRAASTARRCWWSAPTATTSSSGRIRCGSCWASSRPASPSSTLAVPRLSAEAVAELAAPAGVDPRELYRQTVGQPVLRERGAGVGRRRDPRHDPRGGARPGGRLSPGARECWTRSRSSPQRVEVWLLDALAGEHAEALEECLASGVLAARAGVRRVPPRAGAAGRSRRRSSRAGGWRCTAGAGGAGGAAGGEPDLFRLAHHAEARRRRRRRAALLARAGARAAALGAHREAAAQYARALRFVDPPTCVAHRPPAPLLGLLLPDRPLPGRDRRGARAARLLPGGGRPLQGGRDALPAVAARDVPRQRRSTPSRGGLRAVELLEEFPPGPELALAYANLAAIRMNLEDEPGTRLWAARALALARAARRRGRSWPTPSTRSGRWRCWRTGRARAAGRARASSWRCRRARGPGPAGLLEHDLGGLAAPRLPARRGARCRPAWSAAGSPTSTSGGS